MTDEVLFGMFFLFCIIPVVMIRWDKNRFLKVFLTLLCQFTLLVIVVFSIDTSDTAEGQSLYYIICIVMFFGIFPSLGWVFFRKTRKTFKLKNKVEIFLKEWSPELYQEILSVKNEILKTDGKIKELQKLRHEFPEQKFKIDQSTSEWSQVHMRLQKALESIRDNVNSAYISNKLDEIKDRREFEDLKLELLENANSALMYAHSLRSTLEDHEDPDCSSQLGGGEIKYIR